MEILPITKTEWSEVAVAFVDDTDFYTAGENIQYKAKQILEQYVYLYQATGGRIQFDKMSFFA